MHGAVEQGRTSYLIMDGKENKDLVCRRCGACCYVDMVAHVAPEDMARWEKEGRHDIIAHLEEVMWSGDRIIDRTGFMVTISRTSCVYLKWQDDSSYFCEIYETRPMVCRSFKPGSSDLCPLHEKIG